MATLKEFLSQTAYDDFN